MKYAAYSEYKPSGIEWLGDVPSHWKIARSDGIISSERRQVPPEAFLAEDVFHYSIPVVQEYGNGAVEDGESIKSAKQPVLRKSLLVSKLNPRKATITVAEPHRSLRTLCSTEFVPLFADKCDLGFLTYVTLSEPFRQRLDAAVQSVTRSHQRTNPHDIYTFWSAWPSLDEQHTISRFLDAKTAQIDELIAKKRQLIDKLKERRSALIARTVTRGLPPEAAHAAGLEPTPAMKDSGVNWLGKIPEHWECKPIKHLGRVGNGSTPARDNADYWEDGFFPWLNSSMVNEDSVSGAEEFVTALALRECHLPIIKPPAVLIGITGQGRTRGMATILQIEATINQHVAYVKPFLHLVDVHFLRRVFDSAYLFLRSESDGGGSTKGAITCDQIANLDVPLPPLEEQQAIAAYLDREAAQLDALAAKVESAIDRLTEYRQALITSAVTGKIDVRGLA